MTVIFLECLWHESFLFEKLLMSGALGFLTIWLKRLVCGLTSTIYFFTFEELAKGFLLLDLTMTGLL